MANGRIWAIKGVSDRTRGEVLEVAHAEGLNVGERIDRVLSRAVEEAQHPQPARQPPPRQPQIDRLMPWAHADQVP